MLYILHADVYVKTIRESGIYYSFPFGSEQDGQDWN